MRTTGGSVTPVRARCSALDVVMTSAGGPSAMTVPSRMTTIRSKVVAANSMSWVIAMTVRPAARQRRDDRRDPSDPFGVLPRRRLVEHEDGGVQRQYRGERDELAA